MTYRELLAKLETTAGPWELSPVGDGSQWHRWRLSDGVALVYRTTQAGRADCDAALLAAGWTLIDDLDAEVSP